MSAPARTPRRPRSAATPQPASGPETGEHRYRQLFEHLPLAALALGVEHDGRGRVTGLTLLEANPPGRRSFGPDYPLVVGRPATEIFGDAAIRPLVAVAGRLLSGELETTEVALATRNRWFAGIVFAVDGETLLAVASDRALPEGHDIEA